MKARHAVWAAASAKRWTTWPSRMSATPLQFPVAYKKREARPVAPLPLLAVYIIEDDTVLVIACFHPSRDPSHWQRRA